MGVLIRDKQASYEDYFTAIVSAVENPISVSYFGKSGIREDLRLGEFSGAGKKGAFIPTGSGATLSDVGISCAASGTGGPNRFISSNGNTSGAAAIMVVGTFSTAQAFSFANARVSLDGSRVFRILDQAGGTRVGIKAAPSGPCLLYLNSNVNSIDFGSVNKDGVISKDTQANPSVTFTSPSSVNYIGGQGHVSSAQGPTTFYAQAMFNRYLTDAEISAQAIQLIAYANSLGVNIS